MVLGGGLANTGGGGLEANGGANGGGLALGLAGKLT